MGLVRLTKKKKRRGKNQNSYVDVNIFIYKQHCRLGLCFMFNLRHLSFETLFESENLGYQDPKKMYSCRRDLDGNHIGALPPRVFTYNTELTRL